jgi:hypothetical protein
LFQNFPGFGQRTFTTLSHILLGCRDGPEQAGIIMELSPSRRFFRKLRQPGQGLLFGVHALIGYHPATLSASGLEQMRPDGFAGVRCKEVAGFGLLMIG